MSEVAILLSLLSLWVNAWNILQLVKLERGLWELEEKRRDLECRLHGPARGGKNVTNDSAVSLEA